MKKKKKKKKLTLSQETERFYQQLAYDIFEKEELKGVKIMTMADVKGFSPRYTAKSDDVWDNTPYDPLSFTKRDIGIAETLDRKAEELIVEKVKHINKLRGFDPSSEYKELAPKAEKTNRIAELFGTNVSAVLRTLGREGMSIHQARRLIKHYKVNVSDRTIRGQLWCGKQEGEYGECAELTENEIDKLFAIVGEDK